MSKAAWLLVNPSSGNGNKSVSVSSDGVYTGRTLRTSQLTISAADVSPCLVTVNQEGKPEFVQNSNDTASIVKAGSTVTISGTSNSAKLTFSIGTADNTLNLVAPATYKVNSMNVQNGQAIEGDPGASSQYSWSVQFVVALNETIESKTAQLIVTDEAGNQDICVLTQAAGDPTLSVSKEVITLGWEGTAESFDVTSNTSWTIS